MCFEEINFPPLSPVLDSQHKEMIFFLHQLEKDKSNTEKIYNTLLEYLTDHVRQEEAFMEEQGLPLDLLAAHRNSHLELRLMFLQQLAGVQTKTEEELHNASEILRLCLVSHINSYDNTLSNWIAMRRVG